MQSVSRPTERSSLMSSGPSMAYRERSSVIRSSVRFADIRKSSASELKATLFSTVVNMLNTTLGTAILSYAYVFANAGTFWAILLLTFAGMLDCVTSYMMVELSHKVGLPATMNKMACQLSPYAGLGLDLCVILNCVGANVGFTIVSTDNLHAAFGGQRWYWVLAYHALCAPLCYLRTLDSLRFTSLISLAFVVYIIITVGIFSFGGLNPCAPGNHPNGSADDVPQSDEQPTACPPGPSVAFGSPVNVISMLPTITLSFAAECACSSKTRLPALVSPRRSSGSLRASSPSTLVGAQTPCPFTSTRCTSRLRGGWRSC